VSEKVNRALSEAQAAERAIAAAQARQLRALARIAELCPDPKGSAPFDEFASCQVAPALRWTDATATNQLHLAVQLTQRLPETLAALERGELDLRRARALADVTGPLSAEQCRAVEARVLPRAVTQTAPELRQSARRQVIKIDPDGARRRHEQRKQDRHVRVAAAEDGMATFDVHCSIVDAQTAFAHVDALAHAACTPHDRRSLDQRRADAAVDLLTGRACVCATNGGGQARARVQVTVPLTALVGADDQPGELAGYGPIPAQLARELAADASLQRIVTDPVTGAVLDVGTTSYRPPAALAAYVRARDQRCRFPGCRRPGRQCDLDHVTPYPDGPTSHTNLCCLCRRHHRLKTEGGWLVRLDPDGTVTWISPTGRVYVTMPDPIAEPDPPLEPVPVCNASPPF
jgi:Domain of unknown function (DUF222)